MVRATIHYVTNPPGRGEPMLTYVTEDEARSTMCVEPGVDVEISDVRGTNPTLRREGFQLVDHTSAVPDLEALEGDADLDRVYGREMRSLLRDVTGAEAVYLLGGPKRRYGESATAKLEHLSNAKPARYVHGDVTETSALQQATGLASMVPRLHLREYDRWVLYNMWRPITPPPHDHPLAVCDARTIAPRHRVPVLAITEIRGFGHFEFETNGHVADPHHRWCWFRDMTPDEVLVFTTFDSDPTRPHQVAHTAFTDPGCPPGTPTRASVELRALALWT